MVTAEQVIDLEDKVRRLEQVLSAQSGPTLSSLAGDVQRLEANLQHLTATNVSDLRNDVKKLQDQTQDIELNGNDEKFSHLEFSFSSYADLKHWLDGRTISSFGLFWDLFSVLVVMGPKNHGGKSFADESYSSQRTNTTRFENALAAAMEHELPACLYGKPVGDLDMSREGFAGCKTREEWTGKNGQEAYHSLICRRLDKFLSGLRGAIREESVDLELAILLASMVLDQFTHLMIFIDSFYNELTNVAHYASKPAWKLVGKCVGAVFKAQEPARSVVSQIDQDFDSLENRSKFIWAVLQCHVHMMKFIRLNFQGHPAIVKELSLFMLRERADPGDVKSASDAAKAAREQVTKVASQVTGLDTSLAALKRTVDNHSNTLKQRRSNNTASTAVRYDAQGNVIT